MTSSSLGSGLEVSSRLLSAVGLGKSLMDVFPDALSMERRRTASSKTSLSTVSACLLTEGESLLVEIVVEDDMFIGKQKELWLFGSVW
eukprot:CAMPEP_0116850206 /NCGR_PEP_ID=MMETSP0418-20121206/16026_1 /TAXON_ID=1158023 /ORGANISM="Astrosyne radiata, Strain 13vi08-1A" /LENGTH=87 /DNA_ID=CAMNT_0004482067 /DNA_START=212 /DNA_END=472 /DNA_ORIENTATION=+